MAKSYPLTDEIARKNERVILHALAGVTARHVCEVSGLSESALSRLVLISVTALLIILFMFADKVAVLVNALK
ncbi:TPA: hypothetical protein ACFNMH_001971 [Neisseria elongata]|jgi:identified by metaGeneAnnotator